MCQDDCFSLQQDQTTEDQCIFDCLELPGVYAVYKFILMSVSGSERSDKQGEGKHKHYATEVDRFRFVCELFRIPSDDRVSLGSDRVPLRDWEHAWDLITKVCSIVNDDPTATSVQSKPDAPLSGGSAGGKWNRVG